MEISRLDMTLYSNKSSGIEEDLDKLTFEQKGLNTIKRKEMYSGK